MTIDTDTIHAMVAPPPGAGTVAGIALSAALWREGDALTAPGREPISYAELGRAIHEIAGGLADLGIERGDHVAILAGTRPEWTLADFGALSAGATVVPIYQTNSPEECEYILAHAGVRAVFCEDASQVAKVAQVRERCPELEHVIVFEGDVPGAVTLAELRARGAATGEVVVAERLAHVGPHDVATIIYTSGTTGPPKGCVVTHASLLATTAMYVRELALPEGMVIYLFLPLAHSLARVAQYAALEAGGTLAFWGGDPSKIIEELAEIRPTHFPSVPRIYEKVHASVLNGVAAQGRVKRALFEWALREGAQANVAAREGTALSRTAATRHRLADRLVLSKVRGVFGDRLAMAMCGAAPIGREVLEFLDACGVLVLEGYGMTETCAAATLNTPRAVRFGSVGRPLEGAEVAIAEDGEILLAGPHVFQGYHHDAAATEDVMTRPLAALGRPRRDRQRRLPPHHRPQEGPDHHLERQEHLAREPRERAARDPLDLPGGRDRRPAPVSRGAADARSGRGAPARRAARHPGRPRDDGPGRARSRRDPAGRRRGQRPLRPHRADQALRDPRPRPDPGGR